MEFWTTTVGMPAQVARAAQVAEDRGWDGLGIPYAPTMEGQYIIKNLLIIAAALVVGGTVRKTKEDR